MSRLATLLFAMLASGTSGFGLGTGTLGMRAFAPTVVGAVADGVTDGVLLSRQRLSTGIRRPAPTTSRASEPMGALWRRRHVEEPSSDAEVDIPPLEQHPRRKVALLVEPTPFTHVSGYSNRFKEMLRFLQAGGDEAEVITPDDTPERPSTFLGIPITYVHGFRLPLYKQVQLTVDFGFGALRRLMRSRPNLIHAVGPGFFMIPSIIYARLLKIPLVISYHTHMPYYASKYVPIPGLRFMAVKFAEWFLPTTLNWADLTLATSPQLRQQLLELGCENVEVWRKGVDTDVFSPKFNASNEEMRRKLSDGEPHRPLLLYVGRLGAEKNVHLIKEVLQRIPQARFAVVGAGPAEPELREVFKGTDTKFMGLMNGEALSRAYAAADVFVMPSESETLGFVVLEAMASQVPPVGAAAGGIPNLVQDGVNGYLFKPGDVDDLTDKVRRLIGDDKLRAKMGEAGREETLKWNWKAATSVLRNLQYTRAERRFNEREARWRQVCARLNPVSWMQQCFPKSSAEPGSEGGPLTA